MRQKFPVISLIVCLIAVVILCALGTWQIERLHWKNELQHQLDMAFAQENPEPFTATQISELQKGQVVRGAIKGELDLSKSVLFHGRIEDGKSVVAIVAPFTVPAFEVSVPVEVACADPKTMEDFTSQKTKHVTIKGVLREPRWSFATPPNIPAKKQWWRMEVRELGAFWGIQNLKNAVITVENTKELMPKISANISACPIEKQLRNEHLSYVFFWFSMAGILSIIWAIRFLKPYLQSA